MDYGPRASSARLQSTGFKTSEQRESVARSTRHVYLFNYRIPSRVYVQARGFLFAELAALRKIYLNCNRLKCCALLANAPRSAGFGCNQCLERYGGTSIGVCFPCPDECRQADFTVKPACHIAFLPLCLSHTMCVQEEKTERERERVRQDQQQRAPGCNDGIGHK